MAATIPTGQELWRPSPQRIADANVTHYLAWLRATRDLEISGYHELWSWSVGEIDEFWRSLWEYFDVTPGQVPPVALARRQMPGARWFPGARVNFATHLLAQGQPDDIALEHHDEDGTTEEVTWADLRSRVARLARALREAGVGPGDRVAGYLSTRPEAVVSLLATTAIGAVWTCCSPDFGEQAALDRLAQVRPRVLIAVDSYRYGGRLFDRREAVRTIAEGLPDLTLVIVVERDSLDEPDLVPKVTTWDELVAPVAGEVEPIPDNPLPFDHPLWIVYTSGTTGPPKALVHSHGGVLLELLKLTTFHFDLRPGSKMLFFTTTGWIVFPVLVSTLLTGATAVLFDGSSVHPDVGALWRLVGGRGVTHFGTSPAFVRTLAAEGYRPIDQVDLDGLECVICTGSPLGPDSFSWIYNCVKQDLWVTSISGGTDVVSGLVGGIPTLPVHNGEIQVRCLGVDVHAFDAVGRSLADTDGELVVIQPIPTMPIRLWNDRDDQRYRSEYLDTYPGVWHHGDRIRITPRGSCIVSGRSDATLNRHGVRIGTAEIYRIVEGIDGVQDALAVEVPAAEGTTVMLLAVALDEGRILDETLCNDIRRRLRQEGSPRHVPDELHQVAHIPVTRTGKKMEVPVKRLLAGVTLEEAVDAGVVADFGHFDDFKRLAELRATG